MSNTLGERIQQSINDRKLEKNVPGKLQVALSYLTEGQRIALSFDFAEHILWISDKVVENDQKYRNALEKAKQYYEGDADIADVMSARSALISAYYEAETHKDVLGAISRAIRGAISVCCQRDLDKQNLDVPDKSHVSAYDVATSASYAVALYTSGSDWNSNDSQIRQVAREKGKKASDKESLWQIKRLLETVEESD